MLRHENRNSEKILLFGQCLNVKKHSSDQFIFGNNPRDGPSDKDILQSPRDLMNPKSGHAQAHASQDTRSPIRQSQCMRLNKRTRRHTHGKTLHGPFLPKCPEIRRAFVPRFAELMQRIEPRNSIQVFFNFLRWHDLHTFTILFSKCSLIPSFQVTFL
jgi:hypothetical protein